MEKQTKISRVEMQHCPMEVKNCPFMWYVKLQDGTYIYEYDDREDYRNPKETSFDSIDQTQVKELGIMGKGGKVYFDTKDGKFILTDKEVSVLVQIPLSYVSSEIASSTTLELSNIKSQRLIERHEINFDFNFGDFRHSHSSITGWTIGHAGTLVTEKIENQDPYRIEYELMYTLPASGTNYITLNLTSLDKDTDAEVHLKYLNNDDEGYVSLVQGERSTLKIVF